jgi:ABC-type phosphate/phosphonate transport system substrate-binding protein
MKDKIAPLDVSILSSYMGRWLTAILTVFVIAVAISAFIQGSDSKRNIIGICIATDQFGADPLPVFEPLRHLVAAETRRATTVSLCWPTPDDEDLYIMSLAEFVRHERSLGLEALFEVVKSDQPGDKALLIARLGEAGIDLSTLGPGDLVFAGPSSVNGFMAQMSMLNEGGFDGTASVEDFTFAGDHEYGARIVLGVVHGAYRVGACKLSQVERLIESGVIDRAEITVLASRPALPETVIAVRDREAAYYRRRLRRIASLLKEAGSPTADIAASTQRATLRLLRSYGISGFAPADPARMQKARELHEMVAGRFSRELQ